MNVFVLLKQTFDTEEKVRVRDDAVDEDGVKFVINPYDEYAVEEAIRLRDAHGGQVTVVSVGTERCAESLRTALAMGADEAVLIGEPDGADEAVIAKLLAVYMRNRPFDLVIAGHFSVDRGSGQVALRVAELLDLPHAGAVTKLTADSTPGGRAIAVRDAEGDDETVELPLPALITAQQGLNEPRYPTLPGIMKAKKKPFSRLSAADLGLSENELAPYTQTIGIRLPAPRQAGRLLGGETPERVRSLLQALREDAKVL